MDLQHFPSRYGDSGTLLSKTLVTSDFIGDIRNDCAQYLDIILIRKMARPKTTEANFMTSFIDVGSDGVEQVTLSQVSDQPFSVSARAMGGMVFSR